MWLEVGNFWLKYSFEGFSDETFVKFWSNFLNLSESRIKSNLHANEPEWEQIYFEWCVLHWKSPFILGHGLDENPNEIL